MKSRQLQVTTVAVLISLALLLFVLRPPHTFSRLHDAVSTTLGTDFGADSSTSHRIDATASTTGGKRPAIEQIFPEPTEPLSVEERLARQPPPPDDFDATSMTFDLRADYSHDPKGPRPDQFVVLSAGDGGGNNAEIANVLELALENRQEYCDNQGYLCHYVNITRFDMDGAHPVWKKIPAIIETFQTFPDAQWIWMLDLDVILMAPERNMTKQLLGYNALKKKVLTNEQIISKNYDGGFEDPPSSPSTVDPASIDLLIAQTDNGINAGSFLIRRSEFSRLLLDWWRDPSIIDKGWRYMEQTALLHFLLHSPDVRNHVGFLPLREIQARFKGDKEFAWQKGDLAVHLAGCKVHKECQENWDKYWALRGRPPGASSP